MKYATEEYLKRYHYGMYQALKQGTDVKYLEEAFDGDGMLLSGIAVRIMESMAGRWHTKQPQDR